VFTEAAEKVIELAFVSVVDAESPRGEESLATRAAQAAVGRRVATGSDWSTVRRFMDGIVAEVCQM
jgi:hypothetical protein